MKKLKSQDSSNGESFSKNLKVPPPLSTRANASEPFSFKLTSMAELDSPNSVKNFNKIPSSEYARPSTTKSSILSKKTESISSMAPMDYKMGELSVLK